ncbi:MAG: hypothetical protein ACI9DC_004174 [Gammaproteobacteria bacterium]
MVVRLQQEKLKSVFFQQAANFGQKFSSTLGSGGAAGSSAASSFF